MPRIAVFDSGLGSLSVIRPIQRKIASEIIYFADQESFPYGSKSRDQLEKIVYSTINKLEKKFSPDIIVVGSNTPSLLLSFTDAKIVGVFPPLKEASRISITKNIAILATKSVIESKELEDYIKREVPATTRVFKINASPLVELVESGRFITDREFCRQAIDKVLAPIRKGRVDVATLSSTHLPFLSPILKEAFPDVTFLDPADSVAEQVASMLKVRPSSQRLRIFASGNTDDFREKLQKLQIKNKVFPL